MPNLKVILLAVVKRAACLFVHACLDCATPPPEWEGNDADKFAGAKTALANCRKADLPPSWGRHDDALKA
ncbi:hypothetical protein R5W23_006421 [Gemmata sp. JC673]|uniref:Secreted protein n=1 Tax=Gemmata algarum TaxID=2975278 RepID=A0ABU5EV73_9BACT|nr:hypothetical protein [Gemmata algarum]MDY3559203.1 hypothetical protein [Gemmata algarum]